MAPITNTEMSMDWIHHGLDWIGSDDCCTNSAGARELEAPRGAWEAPRPGSPLPARPHRGPSRGPHSCIPPNTTV